MPPAPHPCRYSPISLVGDNLARCVYPLQVKDQRGDYTSSQRRRLDVAAAMVVRPSLLWLWYGCSAAVACQHSGGFGRATTATQTDGHRTAPHGGLATALVRRAGRALCCDDRGASERTKRGTVRLYRAVVSNSVGGVADVQRRLPAANPLPAGCCWGTDGLAALMARRRWQDQRWNSTINCMAYRNVSQHDATAAHPSCGDILPRVTMVCLLIAHGIFLRQEASQSSRAIMKSPQPAATHLGRARSGTSQVPASRPRPLACVRLAHRRRGRLKLRPARACPWRLVSFPSPPDRTPPRCRLPYLAHFPLRTSLASRHPHEHRTASSLSLVLCNNSFFSLYPGPPSLFPAPFAYLPFFVFGDLDPPTRRLPLHSTTACSWSAAILYFLPLRLVAGRLCSTRPSSHPSQPPRLLHG